jgi:hypothetical protein
MAWSGRRGKEVIVLHESRTVARLWIDIISGWVAVFRRRVSASSLDGVTLQGDTAIGRAGRLARPFTSQCATAACTGAAIDMSAKTHPHTTRSPTATDRLSMLLTLPYESINALLTRCRRHFAGSVTSRRRFPVEAHRLEGRRRACSVAVRQASLQRFEATVHEQVCL